MIFLALWAIAAIAAIVHITLRGLWAQPLQRITVLLLYQLAIAWGLLGLLGFAGHVFRPTEIAARIGWPPSPNFQFELGSLELGLAVAALLCLAIRNRYYWLGVTLAPGIFLLLAGANQLREALQRNLAPYNLGVVAPDFLIPLTAAWLLFRVFRLVATSDGTASSGREI